MSLARAVIWMLLAMMIGSGLCAAASAPPDPPPAATPAVATLHAALLSPTHTLVSWESSAPQLSTPSPPECVFSSLSLHARCAHNTDARVDAHSNSARILRRGLISSLVRWLRPHPRPQQCGIKGEDKVRGVRICHDDAADQEPCTRVAAAARHATFLSAPNNAGAHVGPQRRTNPSRGAHSTMQ